MKKLIIVFALLLAGCYRPAHVTCRNGERISFEGELQSVYINPRSGTVSGFDNNGNQVTLTGDCVVEYHQ